MIVNKFTKRMRCSVQGCRVHAAYGLGVKGIDYPMCEEHFTQMIKEGIEILNIEAPEIERFEEKSEQAEKVEEQFFECKYCHEKFPKSEMSVSQFATHTRLCKKAKE